MQFGLDVPSAMKVLREQQRQQVLERVAAHQAAGATSPGDAAAFELTVETHATVLVAAAIPPCRPSRRAEVQIEDAWYKLRAAPGTQRHCFAGAGRCAGGVHRRRGSADEPARRRRRRRNCWRRAARHDGAAGGRGGGAGPDPPAGDSPGMDTDTQDENDCQSRICWGNLRCRLHDAHP